MKVENPFSRHPHVRYTCKPSGCVGVVGQCNELDVPDGTVEVLIEAVECGRSTAKQVFASRLWSAPWGMNQVEDHLKKLKIEEETAKLKAEQEKEGKRKAKEAKERGKVDKNEYKPLSSPATLDVVIPRTPVVVDDKVAKLDPPADMGKELTL
jgi:hypothetical protein